MPLRPVPKWRSSQQVLLATSPSGLVIAPPLPCALRAEFVASARRWCAGTPCLAPGLGSSQGARRPHTVLCHKCVVHKLKRGLSQQCAHASRVSGWRGLSHGNGVSSATSVCPRQGLTPDFNAHRPGLTGKAGPALLLAGAKFIRRARKILKRHHNCTIYAGKIERDAASWQLTQPS